MIKILNLSMLQVMIACASSFVVIKDGQEKMSPFTFSTIRFVLAALGFSPFLGKAMKQPKLFFPAVDVGFWAASAYLAQSVSLLYTDASRGALMSAATVLVVPVLEACFGSNKLHKSHLIAALLAIFGIFLIEGDGVPTRLGDFWSFVSACLFGVQIFRTEYWSKQLGPESFLPMISLALVVISIISILGTVIVERLASSPMLLVPFQFSSFHEVPWFEIIYMAFVVTNFGLWAEVVALQYVTSLEAAIVYTLEPILGAMMGAMLLGESTFHGFGWMGAGMVTLSQLVPTLSERWNK